MTADVIDFSTYQALADNAAHNSSSLNEENFLTYLLWELAQPAEEISAISDSVGLFFENKGSQIYDLETFKNKIA